MQEPVIIIDGDVLLHEISYEEQINEWFFIKIYKGLVGRKLQGNLTCIPYNNKVINKWNALYKHQYVNLLLHEKYKIYEEKILLDMGNRVDKILYFQNKLQKNEVISNLNLVSYISNDGIFSAYSSEGYTIYNNIFSAIYSKIFYGSNVSITNICGGIFSLLWTSWSYYYSMIILWPVLFPNIFLLRWKFIRFLFLQSTIIIMISSILRMVQDLNIQRENIHQDYGADISDVLIRNNISHKTVAICVINLIIIYFYTAIFSPMTAQLSMVVGLSNYISYGAQYIVRFLIMLITIVFIQLVLNV